MNRKIVLVDGNSILEHAFFTMPIISVQDGKNLNAIYGFLDLIFHVVEDEKPEYMCICFTKEAEFCSHYPSSLLQQMEYLVEIILSLQIPIFWGEENQRPQDMISEIEKRIDSAEKVVVVTENKLLLSLVSQNRVVMIPKEENTDSKFDVFDEANVLLQMGVRPEQISDFFAMVSCSNEQGKIGEKTAIQFFKHFDTIEQGMNGEIDFWQQRDVDLLHAMKTQIIEKKAENQFMSSGKLPFSFETASIENMFNPQAFKLMKAYDFEKFYSLFSEDAQSDVDVENSFTLIKSWGEMEKVFRELTGCRKSEETVGMHFVVEEDYIDTYFQQKDTIFTEESGQLSLFAESSARTKSFLQGWAVAFKEHTYFVDTQADWFEEEQFVRQLSHWLKEKIKVSVLDLKRTLYIWKALFQRYELDMTILEEIQMDQIFDLSIAQYLVNPLQETYEYQDIAKEYLDIALVPVKNVLEKASWRDKMQTDMDGVVKTCCYHAYVCQRCTELLKKRLHELQMWSLYEEVELPLVFVLFEMEQRGIRVNKEELQRYGERLAVRISELEKRIYEQAGEEFNINSPKQLGTILFEKLQLPNGKKTKTGYSTSAEVLERLKNEHSIVADILEYRQLAKLKSTYAEGLSHFISEKDGRIHGRFNQTITATGRLSSTDPNLQNIPIRMEIGREIRKVFIPKEGYVFLDADYSQIELRLLAHMSGDQSLIDAYNSGKDIHRITASEVFHVPFEDVTKEIRGKAKAVNFGIVYGISSFSLGQDLNISKKEADQYIERYFATYPGIKKYLDDSVESGKQKGYATSLMGRRRPIPELSSSNYIQRSFGERVAMNSPIQGTAADIIKVAMIRVNDRIKKEKLKSRLLLQIHDELLIETHPDEVLEVTKILEEEMSGVMELAVQLEVEVEQGNNWNEAH